MINIAVSSQKGGVGKTTVAINLVHAYARVGVRTLLVDADPQGSVGLSLTRKSRQLSGFYDFLEDPSIDLDRLIVPTRMETFSLVACGQAGDYETGGNMGAYLARVRSFLHAAAARGFELCILDTSAGLFGVTGDVIASSDAVLIPQQAEPLGIRSVPKLLQGLNRLQIVNPRLKVLGVCLTMVQQDLAESTGAAAALRQLLAPELVYSTQIPRESLFVRASARGLPVGLLEAGAFTQSVFDSLRDETESKLGPGSSRVRV